MDKSIEQISLASKNYADALIQIGQEGSIPFDKLASDLSDINETISASDELKKLLIDPSISEEVKIDILDSIFTNKVDSHLISFLKILVLKNRISEISQIYSQFVDKLNKINNIQPVEIVSAIELSGEYKNRIIEKLNSNLGKTVQPLWRVDSDIIAGLTVKIDDDIIDMSLKNRIDKLSKSLMLK